MILGIGVDLCEIVRVERSLTRFGERFAGRVFTSSERADSIQRPRPAAALAGRFAAKEACSKALGTGFGRDVDWKDIQLSNEDSGRPTMELSGRARAVLDVLTPSNCETFVHVSLTYESGLALALVLIEARGRGDGIVPA